MTGDLAGRRGSWSRGERVTRVGLLIERRIGRKVHKVDLAFRNILPRCAQGMHDIQLPERRMRRIGRIIGMFQFEAVPNLMRDQPTIVNTPIIAIFGNVLLQDWPRV